MIAPIRWERHRLLLLDQTLLPVEERMREYTRWRDVADAIRTLVVRGAPAWLDVTVTRTLRRGGALVRQREWRERIPRRWH